MNEGALQAGAPFKCRDLPYMLGSKLSSPNRFLDDDDDYGDGLIAAWIPNP